MDFPITEICIVSDKTRCPSGYTPIARASDDSSIDADLWKDSLFSFSRIYRYICLCRCPPPNAFVCNVVADIALINDKDLIPTGYSPIEYTADTKEKALRKKLLCIRSVPREFAVDAVCDFIILSREKKPPAGYTIAGELEGMLLCYKYGVIPPNFPSQCSTENRSSAAVYPHLPYPIHPLSHSSSGPFATRPAPPPPGVQHSYFDSSLQRQTSLISSGANTGIEGIPFELNPKIVSSDIRPSLPVIKPLLLPEFEYEFNIESAILIDGLS